MDNNTSSEPKTQPSKEERKDVIDLGGIFRNYLRHWWVFLISLALCTGLAMFYMKKKSPLYLMTGMLMVNQQEDGGLAQSGAMSALMNSIGIGSTTGANPENEAFKLQSRALHTRVVKDLGLNVSCWEDNGFWKRRVNYYKDDPISIYLPEQIVDTLSVSTRFNLTGPASGPWRLTAKQDKKEVLDTEVKKFPYNAKTPYGTFRIDATKDFPKNGDVSIGAMYLSNADVLDWMKEHLGVTAVSTRSDAITVDFEDVVPQRGIDIVNTIMDFYNEGRESDRTAYNKSILDCIDNRLLTLYHELENSESKIEAYKKAHKVVSAEAEAEYIFTRKGAMDQSAVELQSSIQVMEMIQQMLSSPQTKYSLIPFSGAGSLGLGEGYIKLIESYNDLILQRMNLSTSAKGNNSVIAKLDEQIEAMRTNILSSVGRELQSARISFRTLEAEQSRGNARMSEIPSMEHGLITLYRDREVQNAIYGFLLQKREETQIALSQSQPVGKIIDRAYMDQKPISPKAILVYAAALIVAFGVPATVLQLRRRKK